MRWPESRPERSRTVGWAALVCLVLIVMLRGAPEFSNASVPPRGIADPVVALQMARNAAEVDDILGEAPSPDREAMRIKQYLDFAFIASYAGLYLALAMMFRTPLALTAMLLGISSAICEVFENLAILRILNIPLSQTTPLMIEAIRHASLAKWVLAFVATALFGALFWGQRRWGMRCIALLDFAAAAIGFYGIYENAFLVWAGLPLAGGLLLMIAIFVRLG